MKAQECAASADDAGIIKSALRTLQILEHFDEVQQPLSIVAIATALGYPQSSTAALLRSLTTMGYLHYNARQRTYMPTNRVPFLGSWINPALFETAALPRLMRAIGKRTGQLVVLAARNVDKAQYIHVLNEPSAVSHHIRIGQRRQLATSGVGQMLLSAMSNKEIVRLYHRINAYVKHPDEKVDVLQLLSRMANVRDAGYVFSRNRVVDGYAMISLLVPTSCTSQPLALGVGGHCQVLEAQEAEFVQIILEEMKIYLNSAVDEIDALAKPARSMQTPTFASAFSC